MPSKYEIKCSVCDSFPASKKLKETKCSFKKYCLDKIALEYKKLVTMSQYMFVNNIVDLLPRYLHHCKMLRNEQEMSEMLSFIDSPLSSTHYKLTKHLSHILYKSNGDVDFKSTRVVLRTIFPALKSVIIKGEKMWIPFLTKVISKIIV